MHDDGTISTITGYNGLSSAGPAPTACSSPLRMQGSGETILGLGLAVFGPPPAWHRAGVSRTGQWFVLYHASSCSRRSVMSLGEEAVACVLSSSDKGGRLTCSSTWIREASAR